MIQRNPHIQHIYRWYSDDPDDYDDGACLVQLCWGCAANRGSSVSHAETPDQSEELSCEDCGAVNEQGAIWANEMAEHLTREYNILHWEVN